MFMKIIEHFYLDCGVDEDADISGVVIGGKIMCLKHAYSLYLEMKSFFEKLDKRSYGL